jgi:hypothetical protein
MRDRRPFGGVVVDRWGEFNSRYFDGRHSDTREPAITHRPAIPQPKGNRRLATWARDAWATTRS